MPSPTLALRTAAAALRELGAWQRPTKNLHPARRLWKGAPALILVCIDRSIGLDQEPLYVDVCVVS